MQVDAHPEQMRERGQTPSRRAGNDGRLVSQHRRCLGGASRARTAAGAQTVDEREAHREAAATRPCASAVLGDQRTPPRQQSAVHRKIDGCRMCGTAGTASGRGLHAARTTHRIQRARSHEQMHSRVARIMSASTNARWAEHERDGRAALARRRRQTRSARTTITAVGAGSSRMREPRQGASCCKTLHIRLPRGSSDRDTFGRATRARARRAYAKARHLYGLHRAVIVAASRPAQGESAALRAPGEEACSRCAAMRIEWAHARSTVAQIRHPVHPPRAHRRV